MAKYRQLYTEFWSDSFVLELTPEEKYFYLYLMTNNKTTQSGIYEISKITIGTDTGYNRETVEKLIKRFCDYNKILYCEKTKELMMINWIKYNVPNNQNTIKCVNRELKKVKNKDFILILFDKCQEIGLEVDKIFENNFEDIFEKIESIEPQINNEATKMDKNQELSEFEANKFINRCLVGACKPLPSNRIRSNKEEVISKKQEVINKKEEEEVISKKEMITKKKTLIKFKDDSATADDNNNDDGLKNIIKVFEENVHAITPLEYEKILEFTNHVASEVIIMAIDEAIIYNAKTMKYITKILDSWIGNGIKTGEEVKAYQKKWASKRVSYQSQNVKKGGFCDYDQRTYDFETLEKQLLGHLDTGKNTEE
ncbi:DnaD domain protein [Clostridium sp.]|uniref:DnaD domain-containing protein n=1 Tax=Clostridium sp. TaxID=1506 RepID=UPI001A39071A|nr:DnaD domain protein [Clostridium sp.]MBK5237323.1 DnaD domain protein [Clostridium sp.]